MSKQNRFRGKLRLLIQSLKERSLAGTLFRYIRKHGLIQTFTAALTLVEYYYDLRYGTDTMAWVDRDAMGIDAEKQEHATMYQPSSALPVRKMLKFLDLPPGKVFVDLGCGKGLVLMIASESGFGEVRGVEISPLLCSIARNNSVLFREKNKAAAPIRIIESDVAEYSFCPDEEVIYMFNPFDAHILQQVARNIEASLQKRNRKMWIIYNNPRYRNIIEETLKPTRVSKFVYAPQDFAIFEIDRDHMPYISR